jgi:ATP-binding cassette subfamily B (MDR/TAP) protein 1
LDTNSERIVQEALERVSRERTTISIAHRLSTIKNADKIIVMVKGEIVEEGTHESLISNKGLYSRLVEAQNLKSQEGREIENFAQVPVDTGVKKSVETKTVFMANIQDPEKNVPISLSGYQAFIGIAKLNNPELKYTIPGLIAAIINGLVNPVFALVFAEIIQVFSIKGPQLEPETQKWALAFVGMALAALIVNFIQSTMFGYASELLTERIRQLAFASILRQDIEYFDNEVNSTGALTSSLSTEAQKVQGVSGETIGSILQLLSNLIGAIIIAFIFGWKLTLVALAVLPVLVFSGAMRMRIVVSFHSNRPTFRKKIRQHMPDLRK